MQVPYDRILVPQMLHNAASFPVRIAPNSPGFLPGTESLISDLPWMIANEFTQQTQQHSPIRIHAYNIVSQNNWNNNQFYEVCKNAANYQVFLFSQRMIANLFQNIQGLISEFVVLASSHFAANVPMIINSLSPDARAKISNNANLYVMRAQQCSQGTGMGMGNTSMASVADQALVTSTNMAIPQNNPSLAGLTRAQAKELEKARLENKPIDNVNPSNLSRADAKHLNALMNTNVIHEIEGDIGMNRQLHSIVYKSQRLASDTAVHDSAKTAVSLAAVEAADLTPREQVIEEHSMNCFSLNDIIHVIQAGYNYNATKGVNIHTFTVIVSEPVFSPIDIKVLFDSLKEANTFKVASGILKQHYEDMMKTPNARYALAYISIIDKKLTTLVNDFLKSLRPGRQTKIDSFVEDGTQLASDINQHFTQKEVDQFGEFQRRIMANLFKLEPYRSEAFESTDNVVYYNTMNRIVNVGYLTASLCECGVGEAKAVSRVVRERQPVLFQLIATLVKIGKANAANEHFLLTLDEELYKIEIPVYDDESFILEPKN